MTPYSLPDPYMKKTLQECIDDYKEWNYYDNFQHGDTDNDYRNQNESGYGPIEVFNSNVGIVTECLKPTESDEKFKKVWGKYDTWHHYWHGDLSRNRFKYLIELSKKFKQIVEIEICNEHDKVVWVIKNGEVRNEKRMW
jgi:hypothetical protein